MANTTTKSMTPKDADQAIRQAYNDAGSVLSVDGFLALKVGHKVTLTITTTTAPSDTQVFDFYDGATLLWELTIIYTDSTYSQMISATRTA